MDFDEWMAAVNLEVEGRIGLSTDDLADKAYMDMFEDGYSPSEAVEEVLEDEGIGAF